MASDNLNNAAQTPPLVDLRHYIERLIQHEHDLTATQFDALARAVDKAERSMTLRLEGMNEFRKQLEAQESRYASFAALDTINMRIDGLAESVGTRLATLEKAENIMTGKTGMLWLLIVIGLSVVGFLTKFFGARS